MTKADLHRLVDELPEEAVDAVARVLERAAADPMAAVLDAAAWDDEPYTDDQRHADAAALKEPALPIEEVRREMAD